MTHIKCELVHTNLLKCIYFCNIIRSNFWLMGLIMSSILWDGESIFPEKIELFKKFLKKYLIANECAELLEHNPFHYDPEQDEFLNSDIQEYYHLWSIA